MLELSRQGGSWREANSVITYDRLTFDEISGGESVVGSGMDITTGVFTVGLSGVWSVSYSLMSQVSGGEINQVNLYLNGLRISESYQLSSYNGQEDMVSMGSRNLYMRLVEGDEVTLRTRMVGILRYVTICFQLVKYDGFL